MAYHVSLRRVYAAPSGVWRSNGAETATRSSAGQAEAPGGARSVCTSDGRSQRLAGGLWKRSLETENGAGSKAGPAPT